MAVVETGSIAAAARQQGLTAAAVSQRIRVLEDELGHRLLRRDARSAVPTPDCLRMLPAARDLIRDAGRLKGYLSSDGLSGSCRVGAISTALLDRVPDMVRAFNAKAPQMELYIQPGTSQGLYQKLLTDELDAAIMVSPPFKLPREVMVHQIGAEPFVHIKPGKDNAGTVGADNLPWIVYDRRSWGGRLAADVLERKVRPQSVLCELDALETIASLVDQGLGQAIVPGWPGLKRHHPGLCLGVSEMIEVPRRQIVLILKRSLGEQPVGGLLSEVLSAGSG